MSQICIETVTTVTAFAWKGIFTQNIEHYRIQLNVLKVSQDGSWGANRCEGYEQT